MKVLEIKRNVYIVCALVSEIGSNFTDIANNYYQEKYRRDLDLFSHYFSFIPSKNPSNFDLNLHVDDHLYQFNSLEKTVGFFVRKKEKYFIVSYSEIVRNSETVFVSSAFHLIGFSPFEIELPISS